MMNDNKKMEFSFDIKVKISKIISENARDYDCHSVY